MAPTFPPDSYGFCVGWRSADERYERIVGEYDTLPEALAALSAMLSKLDRPSEEARAGSFWFYRADALGRPRQSVAHVKAAALPPHGAVSVTVTVGSPSDPDAGS